MLKVVGAVMIFCGGVVALTALDVALGAGGLVAFVGGLPVGWFTAQVLLS